MSIIGKIKAREGLTGRVTVMSHAITQNLIDCGSSGTTYVVHGDSFSTSLRNSHIDYFSGYIKVTMDGEDITDDVCEFYNATYDQWHINIPSVTGDVYIYCNWFESDYEEEEYRLRKGTTS